MDITASGGIRDIEHIRQLKDLDLYAAITGKAMYAKTLSLTEAIKLCEGKIIIVDFHAEATSEKKAMGFYLDGRVTAVLGTHTHVQTADETILPSGTAYITDAGMTGAELSVLGVKSELAIEKIKYHAPVRFEESENPCFLNGVIVDFDEFKGKANKIIRIIER